MSKFSTGQLRIAVEQVGLPAGTAERIEAALYAEAQNSANFETAHISYYLGALLIIGAMGWFVTNAWDRLSGFALSSIAIAYSVLFGSIGVRLIRKAATKIPGGLLVSVAVCMTPTAVYGIERAFSWWPVTDPGPYTHFHPLINANWVAMECVTVAVSMVALRLVPLPFVTAPAAYALWYLSMDGTALLFGAHWSFHQECWISVVFGLMMLTAAFLVDGLPREDFSFWFYLFGLLTFTGGLTLLGDGNQFGKAMYCLVHLALIALALNFQRRAFLVFGAIGVFSTSLVRQTGTFAIPLDSPLR